MPNLQKHISVLFVDDEPEMLGALADFFSTFTSVRTATDGRVALEMLRDSPADIIVADQRMPGINGTEFLSKSRKICPESERILMTAYADVENIIQSINEARISYFLTKPVDFQQLRLAIERLAEIVQLRRSRTELLTEVQNYNRQLEDEVMRRSAALHATNQNLMNLQQIREQMTRMAVHDLKTPLANTRLAVNGLAEYCAESTDARDMASIALQSIDAMTSLVENMLSIATLTKGEFTLKHDIVVPCDLLRSSIAAFKQAALKKSITIHEEIALSTPETIADTQQLRHVLDNLISNAIKYTRPGGEIAVSLTHDDTSYIFSIADNGLGMTADDIANAFQEFRRLSATPTNGESSTGLGLFIVKKIVDLHGGEVSVASPGKGQGTAFTVRIPFRPVTELSTLNI
ncbi:MAG TPA: hybrid sensor histidine kinase/response regulator [Patescibacteria group bacterium]|nr:hybrid sensor histidine kinase/response regulator [Patescibacteria group bacterium]